MLERRVARGLRIIVWALCLSLGGGVLHGWGKAQTDAPEPRNKEWALCVTAFDISALPPGRRQAGEVLTRSLLESLKLVEYRLRLSQEYTYYKEYAWTQSVNEAAKKLASKRNERDQLLYRGEPAWKYRKNLKTIDKDIQKLEEEYVKVQGEIPVIASRPVFVFAGAPSNGAFPAPPQGGGEYRFCQSQRADGFLAGVVSDFHGRLYITVKLYTLYTRSFQYEDSIIFSSEDMTRALDELAGRLVAAVSGMDPALIAVYAEPEEALVTIKGSFAGRGTVTPREYPPGEWEVEVFAENYKTVTQTFTISPGELAELYVKLQPVSREALTIDTPGKLGTSVYQGALYLGDVPHTLSVPSNSYTYITVETAGGETGGVVATGTDRGRGNIPVFDVRTRMPPGEGEKPVERSRRQFYNAYGRVWFALPAAILLGGIYSAYLDSYNRKPTEDMYNETMKYYYISIGATVLAGAALAETFFRIYRYVKTSGTNTTPPIIR